MTGMKKPADRSQYREFDSEIGQSASRFLDRDLLRTDPETSGPWPWVRSRIDGLEDIPTVRAWKAVERALRRGENGPRKQVMAQLDAREAELSRTDFDEWLQAAPKADDVETTESVVRFVRETPDGEIEASDGRDRGPFVTTDRDCLDRWRQRQQAAEDAPAETPDPSDPPTPDADGERAAAADGGTTCVECGEVLVEHDIGGESGLWCPECGDWRGETA